MTILTLSHESPFQLESRDDILYDDAYWTWIGTFNEMMLVGRGWKGGFPDLGLDGRCEGYARLIGELRGQKRLCEVQSVCLDVQ